MSKKITATIVVLLMTLSIFSVMSATVPVAKAQGDVDVFLRPGAPDPYKPGFSHTLGTLRDNPDVVIAQYLDYAILTDSVGDLQFDIMVNVPIGYIDIFYPCEFTFTRGSTDKDAAFSVWTDITNDYGFISVSVADCQVTIGSHADLAGTLAIEPNLYHVRLLGMKAPAAFGAYYFEIDLDGTAIPQEDWPIIVVKGELNPAYITGIVTAASGVADLKVEAKGTTPEGRSVEGLFYFFENSVLECPNAGCPDNEAGDYVYWLFGAPAGAYEITASAIDDGYAPSTSDRFSVNAGQSHHGPDISLSLGPLVTITVWSKHGRGTLPWGCLWQPPYGTNDPTTPTDQCGDAVRQITIKVIDANGDTYLSDTFDLDPEAVSWPQTFTVLEAGKTYTMEAYVTGYVMEDIDAWQRTFTVSGDAMSVEMDLRRSNWFEITAHTFEPNNPMTVVYEARNEAGELKGLTAYEIPAGGFPADGPSFIVLEGFNHEGDTAGGDTYSDYGLKPGTYEIKMYAADGTPPDPVVPGALEGTGWYYIPAGEPTMASIALCNSPSTLSFSVEKITMTFTLRSVDWETPAHVRQWTFPGAEIWVDFVNADTDEVAASLDPTVWGFVQDDIDPGTGLAWIGSPYLLPDGRLSITWTGDNVAVLDALTAETYPTHIPPGEYNFVVNTVGYVTRRVFPVWVPAVGSGDIQADLVQGGEISVGVSFTKEGQDVNFNGFVRVEVYDKDGNLKGANIYGQAVANWYTTVDGGGSYSRYVPDSDWKLIPCAAEASNIDNADGDECLDGQRGFTSSGLYSVPWSTWANWPNMDPSYANRLALPGGETATFDVFGFYWYYGGPSSRNEGLWANGWETTDGTHQNDHGLAGSRDIAPNFLGAGTYTVKVYAFDPLGADGVFGTADDWASYYADPVENIDLPWGAAQAISVSLAEMGRLSGTITWIDMYGDMKAMPWATLTASSPEVVTYTTTPIPVVDYQYTEPAYFMWLPAGTHDVAVSVSGPSQVFGAASFTVAMSDGFRGTQDQRLDSTGVPVPEFPLGTALALLSALSASIYLLRRRRTAKN